MMLGIDFGTSNSAVALVGDDGVLQGIPLEAGRPSMPTALFFSNETGQVFYGSAAMQAYLSGTDGRLMRSIKSLLGSSLMDEQTLVNGQLVSLFEVVVLFFKELKRRAEQHLGHAVSAAMLGRPVHFVDDDLARDDLAQATLGRAALADRLFERVERVHGLRLREWRAAVNPCGGSGRAACAGRTTRPRPRRRQAPGPTIRASIGCSPRHCAAGRPPARR